jgi:hypothetical protein
VIIRRLKKALRNMALGIVVTALVAVPLITATSGDGGGVPPPPPPPGGGGGGDPDPGDPDPGGDPAPNQGTNVSIGPNGIDTGPYPTADGRASWWWWPDETIQWLLAHPPPPPGSYPKPHPPLLAQGRAEQDYPRAE